jgi:hypothetical protein
MKYFCLEPEVAGGLGQNTVLDRSVHPPIVRKLHHHFDGWLGDALLESFPCFIATEAARLVIEAARLTGVRFERAEVTASEQFRELYPGRTLPPFAWLVVSGKAGREDFGLAEDARLVVSETALEALRKLGVDHAVITKFG